MSGNVSPACIRALLWILLALCGSALAQDPPDAATAISEVLASHPGVRSAQFKVEAAEATLSGSRAQPNPTLTLSAVAGDPEENANSLVQTLEISGQPRIRHEQALAQLEAARLELRSVRRRVAGEVYSGWIDVWERQRLARLADLRMALMREMVRVSKRRYEVGEIPQNESLRMELAEAEAEADQRKATAAYQAAVASLELLRGQPLSTTTALDAQPNTPTLAPPAETPSLPVSTEGAKPLLAETSGMVFNGPSLSTEDGSWSLESTLLSAQNQLEVEALRQEQRASVLAAELIGKERAPQLGLALYRSSLYNSGYEQGAQLSISWPIFDWGSVGARQRSQMANARAQESQIEEKILAFRKEVATLWNQWQAARSVRDILITQAERYEELAREARIGYDLGLLTLTDVLQTETAFRQAGVQLIQSQAEIRRLELSLLERTNLPWPSQLLEDR